jgi:hypothetical protein
MASATDAKNQRTNHSYLPDDNIHQITYTDTNGQPLNPPTPSVSFTYDTNYNRVASMTDGSGPTIYELQCDHGSASVRRRTIGYHRRSTCQ